MDRWDKKLKYRPVFYYNKYVFRQDTSIIMIVDTPAEIIGNVPDFLEDLYITVFRELQEVK